MNTNSCQLMEFSAQPSTVVRRNDHAETTIVITAGEGLAAAT